MKKHVGLVYTMISLLMLCAISKTANAQRDTTKRQSIDITSTYKPVLRNAVKINLSASPLAADTNRPRLAYNIPSQQLFFSYQPISLKPLSLAQDTALQLGGRNFVKAGFGNFSTPYVGAGLSFGDGKQGFINLYGNYTSSKGKIEYQDFSQVKLKATGSYFNKGNEAYGNVGIYQDQYYLYGFDHALHNYTKDSLSRKYQDIALQAGFRNTDVNKLGINYNPNARVHVFTRANFVTENNLIIEAPVEKKFGEDVAFKITARAELTNLTDKKGSIDTKFNNNLVQLAPELVYYSDRFTIHGGVTPSWDNGQLSVLPNIYGEAQLQDNVFLIQAGWIGRYTNNTFRKLSGENPYMQDPTFLLNTKETEFYGGVKATLGAHFSFNAKSSFIKYNNIPLFINDPLYAKSFYISNESKMSNLHVHGDLSYISQDKFTLSAALDLNTYTGLKDNAKAWHKVPIQLTGSARWNAFKQVILKADLLGFGRVPALLADGSNIRLKGFDVSAGAEFKVTKRFSAWLDINNILNRKYSRWNNYPVYGLNAIGGVVVHF
ncbi:MAG: hypothetical protein ABIR81_06780 [Ginsengibacter sp.]